MDILLERMLSLIPKKPDGKYVHGEKKKFCLLIGAPTNIISEWESGKAKSYRNYVYAVSQKFNVSVEWLRGETDIKEPATQTGDGSLDAELAEALILFRQLWPENKKQVIDFSQALLRIQESSGVHPLASS